MAVRTFLLGREGVAYFDNVGTDIVFLTTPAAAYDTWLALASNQLAGDMTDVRLSVGAEFADATTRETAAGGFASNIAVLNNGQVTFDIRWRPGDGTTANFAYQLLAAWGNFGTIAMAFFDQPKDVNPGIGFTTTVQGLIGNFSVSMEKQEALRDVQRASVTLSLSDSGSWYSITNAGS